MMEDRVCGVTKAAPRRLNESAWCISRENVPLSLLHGKGALFFQ